jgi:hypothetical protein
MRNFLSDILLYIGIICYLITMYNYLLCFLVEPGIIPRNHELFLGEGDVGKIKNTQSETKENQSIGEENKNNSIKEDITNNSNDDSKEIKSDILSSSSRSTGKRIINMFPGVNIDEDFSSSKLNIF